MLFLLSGFPDGCFLFCFSLFHFVSLLSKMQILLPGRHSSPDMTLLFVDVQHIPDRPCHGRVDLLKAIGTVFMYRRLTDPKLLRRLPHRSFCFYDIARNFYCTLLNIILQGNPPIVVFLQCMREYKKCMYRYAFSKTNLILKFYFDFYFNHTPLPFFWIFLLNFIHIIVTWRLFLFQNISIKPAFPGQAH